MKRRKSRREKKTSSDKVKCPKCEMIHSVTYECEDDQNVRCPFCGEIHFVPQKQPSSRRKSHKTADFFNPLFVNQFPYGGKNR